MDGVIGFGAWGENNWNGQKKYVGSTIRISVIRKITVILCNFSLGPLVLSMAPENHSLLNSVKYLIY